MIEFKSYQHYEPIQDVDNKKESKHKYIVILLIFIFILLLLLHSNEPNLRGTYTYFILDGNYTIQNNTMYCNANIINTNNSCIYQIEVNQTCFQNEMLEGYQFNNICIENFVYEGSSNILNDIVYYVGLLIVILISTFMVCCMDPICGMVYFIIAIGFLIIANILHIH